MGQELPNADQLCLDLSDLQAEHDRFVRTLMHDVAAAWEDGIITDEEKRRCIAVACAGDRAVSNRFASVRRTARHDALMQQVGIRIIRRGRCDKNLLTLMRSLCADEEQAKAASQVELAAAGAGFEIAG